VPPTREYGHLKGRPSVDLTQQAVAGFDAVLIATGHDAVDYAALAAWAPLIVDTRNAFGRRSLSGANVVKA
jgi:UDP-N-acetyl-D-glucosamine dehydrogenase